MNDTERVLGRLQEFKESTERRLDVIERKMDMLTQFKWRATGALGMIVAGFEVAKMWLEKQQ